jgi:hypothetical protein
MIRFFQRKKEITRGWKTRSIGNNQLLYSEWIAGEWVSIAFAIELYAKGYPRHVIYLPKNEQDWPEWAQDQRKVIIGRIKEVYKEPAYSIVTSIESN